MAPITTPDIEGTVGMDGVQTRFREDKMAALMLRAQYFVDCKYTAHADARQRSMGLAYVTAERQDLAKEIANFAASILKAESQT